MADSNGSTANPLEDSFLSEGKLMVRGSRLWSRNKMPFLPLPNQSISVPEAISTLDEALFRNFVRDIQASVRLKNDSTWPSSEFWFFYVGWILIRYLTDSNIVQKPREFYCWVFLAIALVLYHIWCKTFRDSLESDINARLEEWQPLFANAGFSVEYVLDKPHWWNTIETYLLIQPAAVQATKLSPTDTEANYMVYFSRSFIPRSQGFRVLAVGGRSEGRLMVIPKAPTLQNLDTRVFSEVMNEARAKCLKYHQLSGWIALGAFFLTLVIGIIFFPKYCIMAGLAVPLAVAALYFNVLPALGMFTLPVDKLDEWDHRLQEHGYALSYHVDKPTWWQWQETYLKIRFVGAAGSTAV